MCIFGRFSGFWEIWEIFACKTCYIDWHLSFKEIYYVNYSYHFIPVLTLKWSLNMSWWSVSTSQKHKCIQGLPDFQGKVFKVHRIFLFWLLWCSVYSSCDQVAKTSILHRLFILFIAVTWSLTGNEHPCYASEKTQSLY